MKISEKNQAVQTIQTTIVAIFAVVYGTLLIIFAKDVGEAVKFYIEICLTAIIPSMFAFMALSTFIVSTGIYRVLSRPFGGISRTVFRIPAEYFSIFLLSCIAGYPIGAKLLAESVRKNPEKREIAAHLQCFCFMGGPAYFCGIISLSLFGNITFGLIIFGVIFSVNVIIGILSGITRPMPPKKNYKIETEISAEKFFSAIKDGGASILMMCGVIIFFGTFICILEKLGFINFTAEIIANLTNLSFSDATALTKAIFEINNLRALTPGNVMILPIITMFLSFGGICVALQMYQFAQGFINVGKFAISRFTAAVMSYIFVKIILWVVPELTALIVSRPQISPAVTKDSFLPSVFIIIMILMVPMLRTLTIKKEEMK
ncbi:MAG: hypothetical protein LBM87_04125 [Ruminococcus sp.]|jgi:hypothetical protein|nr:hypothetical protein [Ruminococcus sp.]